MLHQIDSPDLMRTWDRGSKYQEVVNLNQVS